MSTSPVSFRQAARRDLSAISALLMEHAGEGSQREPRLEPADQAHRVYTTWIEQVCFNCFQPFPACWIAASDDQLVGTVIGRPAASDPFLNQALGARVEQLWVQPAFRRQGIASALLRRFTGSATKAGFHRLEVAALAHDPQALAFWHNHGFDDLVVTLQRTPPPTIRAASIAPRLR